ncbi:hypothetical protein V6Z11_A11G218100 [Gossypium hirsutum]
MVLINERTFSMPLGAGYEKLKQNIIKGVPDLPETVDVEVEKGSYGKFGEPLAGCNQWPKDPPNFKTRMEECFRLCTGMPLIFFNLQIMYLMINLIGCVLAFGCLAKAFWMVRLNGYPGLTLADYQHSLQNQIGDGIHTDYGLLSLINQDDDITALEIWSNGIYEATLHRVINNFPKYRVSVGYFYEGDVDAVVEPLEMWWKTDK